MKTMNNQEHEKKVTTYSMDGINKYLDFLSLSVEGLKILDSPLEHQRKYNLEWSLKKVFADYYEKHPTKNEKYHIKNEQQETFLDFSDAIKIDMDIWRDYCGITENIATKGIIYNTDGNIEYCDGINHLQIQLTEKYGDDNFPYLQLLKHNNFIDLLADTFIYSSLKGIASEEVNNLNETELSLAEYRIKEIEKDLPDNFNNKDCRFWYLETRYALIEIKSSILGQLSKNDRDIKSFVYLIYLVFSHAGFEISKATKFSEYLALFLRESKFTIDEYLKDAAKESLPLWKKNDRKTQRLIAILMRIETFNPKKETLDSLSKSIREKIPKVESNGIIPEQRYLRSLNIDERTFFDKLEIRYKQM